MNIDISGLIIFEIALVMVSERIKQVERSKLFDLLAIKHSVY